MKDYKLEVSQYGNVDCRFGIPSGWIITDLTKSQLNKLNIPFYEGLFGFSEKKYGYYKPILGKIIPEEFESIAKEYLAAKEAKIESIQITKSLIAECLYSVNKEAKRQRDIKERHAADIFSDRKWDYSRFESGKEHYIIRNAKRLQNELYQLKDKVLKILIVGEKLQPVGYHKFADKDRDYYEFEGFGFHIDEKQSEIDLGSIEEHISAERKRSIPPAKAKKILERYINDHNKNQ